MVMFKLGCTSDKIWNLKELIAYLFANQGKDIEIQIFPEAISLKDIGLYDLLDLFKFNQVIIHTYNPFEHHDKYKIIFKSNFWFNKQENIDSELHNWNQEKLFFCLYHRPTASRLGLAGHLFMRHRNTSLIHFSAELDADNLMQFELDKLLTYCTTSVQDAGILINNLPLLLSSSNRYTYNRGYYFDDPLTNFYKDILIDVVVESHVYGNTFFPTEKTTRPMWLKKPFIVFGSKNYLEYLRQMGFRTFGDFWNEDYDGYEGPERFKKICELIDQIATKSHNELKTMYWDMTYSLDHNYRLLISQSYNTRIIELHEQ
jgi:hypothetical protein